MKMNITIDVQDIFDDATYDASEGRESCCNLNEVIKGEIINGIKLAISKDCLKSVEDKSKAAIESVISESVEKAKQTIESRALEFTNEWLEKKTVISDKWGDPVNELTISELIKQQFDNLLEKTVDNNGRFSNGFGSNCTLLQHLTGKKVEAEVESRMAKFGLDIDKQITAHIESGIKRSVSNKFAEMVIQTAKSQNAQLESK